MTEEKPWIVANCLEFAYGNDVIFDGISFALSEHLVALQGPSGSGKTTLLKLINRDLLPNAGKVFFEGVSAILILQDDSLLPWLTGADNLKISKSFNPDTINDTTIISSMEGFIYKSAYQMSFGQRRYIEIVRALGSESDVLLLDEPLNFLDADRRSSIIKELYFQAKKRRILMSTHYIEDFEGVPVNRIRLMGSPPFREVSVL